MGGAPAAQAQAPPSTATTEAPSDVPASTSPLVVPGVARAAESVGIHAYVDGAVARVVAQPGDVVRAGDLLLELHNPELVQLVAEARAKLAQAQALARAAELDSQMAALELTTSLGEWEADYEAAVASLANTRFESTRTIHDQQRNMAFTLSDVERGQTDLDRARNQLTHAQLQREATQARGASLAIGLTKAEREKQRMEELQAQNFASASAVEEAQLSHATAVTASEEHTQGLAARDEDVKAALDEIASSERLIAIWTDALGHETKSLEAVREGRKAREQEAELAVRKAGVRRDATRAFVDLDEEKSAHTVAAAAAAVGAAEAAVAVAVQQVEWLRVSAPVDGVVAQVNVSAGELARSGRTTYASEAPLLTLVDPARLVAEVALPTSQLLGAGLGKSVHVSLPGAPGSVEAKVSSVRREGGTAGMYVVTIDLPLDSRGIAPASVVLVRFE